MRLDDWQREILEHEGNILLCTGRQVGKTMTLARKAAKRMLDKPNSKIIVISLTEDQAKLIILMILNYLERKAPKQVKKKNQFTNQTKITLTNRSQVIARPVGNTGDAIRGFTGDVLIIDEASRMSELAFEAGMPVLLTTGGEIWMASTPHGKRGFFWNAYNDSETWKVWHISSEEVIQNRPISDDWTENTRNKALKFLEKQKELMSELSYGQEYLGLFLDDLQRFFTDEQISKACILKKNEKPAYELAVMGNDLARMGGDEFAAMILGKDNNKKVYQLDMFTKRHLTTVENENLIREFTMKWKCNKVGIDAGAGTLGVSVLDHLLKDDFMKRKVIAMNNRKIEYDRDGHFQRLYKEDLYDNLRSMMERGEIYMFNDEKLITALRSVQIEFSENVHKQTTVQIYSNPHDQSHIVEALVRAAQLARESKILNMQIHSIKV